MIQEQKKSNTKKWQINRKIHLHNFLVLDINALKQRYGKKWAGHSFVLKSIFRIS